MRIHLQNHPNPTSFPLTPEVWNEACARSPDVSVGHEVSFGSDLAAYRAVEADLDILIAQLLAIPVILPIAPARLKMVFCTSAGLEKLAPYDWLPAGVPLLNNRGTHAAKAGEYGIMALLMLASRIPILATAQREGRWMPLHGSVLAGRTVVVVGLGSLGSSIAAQARLFGMHVVGVRNAPGPHPSCDRVVGPSDLDGELPSAEFLVLATPLTPATTGILSRERIELLPRAAGVVNVGRGGLIDQDALLDALDREHLSGAVLDVVIPEPVPPGHRLWTTRNLIITPHTAIDDPRSYNALTLDIFFANLRALEGGLPLPNRFDPSKGY